MTVTPIDLFDSPIRLERGGRVRTEPDVPGSIMALTLPCGGRLEKR